MARFFTELSYKGTHFHGWQIQPNARTIQAELNMCFQKILRDEIDFTGAGRTDTGVHASYFVAHFDTEKRDQLMAKSFLHRINGMLHPDIAVHRIWEVDENAHARFDALTRTYLYQIHQVKDPFINDVSHYYHGNLDLEAMNKAAAILTQTTDFKSFSKQHTDVKTYICRIEEACWEQKGSRLIFTIRADRFLRNMVRAIVGTLLDIGKESISQETFADIISSKDRSRAGMSAPAHGLILHSITYPERIMTG